MSASLSSTDSDTPIDCLCAGIIVADHVCRPIDHLPAAGELVLTERMELTTGGCASNVAADLAKLNRRATIVGRVGDDIFGRFVRESLESAGVDCSQIEVSTTAETSGTLIINVAGQDRRFVHAVGANAEFAGESVTRELVGRSRVVYLGGYFLCDTLTPEKVIRVFKMAREAGVPTVLDVVVPKPAEYWSRLEPVLPYTDYFLPNDDEAAAITGESDPLRQATRFLEAGVGTAVVTCGMKGSILVSGETRIRAAAYPVDFVDGTGSGDAFVAGFVHGLLDKADPADCLRRGSALGASCVRATGASTGVFRVDELADFVSQQTLAVESL